MSPKTNYANLLDRAVPVAASIAQTAPVTPNNDKPASREDRKQITGFFTPAMSLAMHMIARRKRRSLQP